MRRSLLRWGSIVMTGLMLCPVVVHAAGTPGATSAESQALQGDEAAAAAAGRYQQAMALKAEAWRQEEIVANRSEGADTAAAQAAQRHAYQEIIKQLQLALKVAPRYVEATTELGYALRQSGNFRKAIGAYNYALGINEEHFEAVEYRGQAYLAVDDLDKAKQDYMRLFRGSPELADRLLAAMDTWLTRQPVGSMPDFSLWLDERRALAGQSARQSARW